MRRLRWLTAAWLGLATTTLGGCEKLEQKLEEEKSKRQGDDLAVEGAKAFKAGNYTEAIEKLEESLEKGLKLKKADEVQTTIGNAYMELDEYDRAVEHHLKALEINPKNHMAMVNLGATYRKMDRLDDAEKMYTQAAELAPDYPELHASLGALYLIRGDAKKAESSLRRSIELEPKLAIAHANLSLTLGKLGRFEEADASLKTALELGYKNGDLVKAQLGDMRKSAALQGEREPSKP